MRLQTILNRVQRHKSFVYKKAALVERKAERPLSTDPAASEKPRDLFGLRPRWIRL